MRWATNPAASLSETFSPLLADLVDDVVRTTTGVKLRGPERSEGHVSFNFRVMPLLALARDTDISF
jgi:hypothetical protein